MSPQLQHWRQSQAGLAQQGQSGEGGGTSPVGLGPGARVGECGQARGIWRGQAPDRGRAVPGAPETRVSEGGRGPGAAGSSSSVGAGRHPGTPPHTTVQSPGPGAAEGPWGPPTCTEQRSHATLQPPSGQSRSSGSECPAGGRGCAGGAVEPAGPWRRARRRTWPESSPGRGRCGRAAGWAAGVGQRSARV